MTAFTKKKKNSQKSSEQPAAHVYTLWQHKCQDV